ncbi:MAG: OmpP1/FadL family transporter [Bradymonadia bacterium]
MMNRLPLVALGALLCATPAQASVLEIFGFSARGTAMGSAQTAAANDYTATFYNPAALTVPKRVIVGAGVVGMLPRLTVDRDFSQINQRDIEASYPGDAGGFTLGALFPLGGLIDNRVAVGVGVYVPTLALVRGEGVDSQRPQFYRYENLPDKYVLLTSVAFEFTDWISIGIGAQVLAQLNGAVLAQIDVPNGRVNSRQIEVELRPTAAPVAGVHVRPTSNLSFGLSWRGNVQLDYGLPAEIQLEELLSLDLQLGGTVLYHPDIVTLGAAWQISDDWLTSLDVSYAWWSGAPDPSPRLALDISGTLVDGLGLEERLDGGSGNPIDLSFKDVPQVRLGVEHTPIDALAIRAGYSWRPTPAPIPSGAFNYIDTDAHIVSLGLGVVFQDPLEIRRNPIHLDAVYQGTVMASTRVDKAAGTRDPVGGYDAGGVVHFIGLTFRHDL